MAPPVDQRQSAVNFGEAVRFWVKLGFISFGGPAGQIAIMHSELVERRRWISERRFLHALNYCMVLPGPEAQQLATYIGWLMHGVRGGLAAGALFVLPSLAILIALSWAYMTWGETPLALGMLMGVKPAVVGIVSAAVLRVGTRAIRNLPSLLLAAGALVALWQGTPFPAIIAAAGVLGYLGGRLRPEWFQTAGHGARPVGSEVAAAIFDDHHDIPPQALLSRGRWLAQATVGLVAWLAPMAILIYWVGPRSPLASMGQFFTQAALVTFGGAYAVLPYVMHQAAVAGWCERPQSMVGLALGETTPGPLIMFVAFVGFVGGWQTSVAGAPPPGLAAGWQSGAVGATVATYFTFLPSFVFVLLGAPLIERTRGELRLAAALAGITAAVVGVMTHLAIFLAREAIWRAESAPFLAAMIAVGSFLAVRLGRLDIGKVVLAAAAIGLAARMLLPAMS